MCKVYLGIGSNLGDKKLNLKTAVEEISELAILKKVSEIYHSKAWGYQSKNDFMNQVVLIETKLQNDELFFKLKEIEQKAGRITTNKGYTDRILDIDILFIGNQIFDTSFLTIPHPKLHLRKFVLEPLLELEDIYHPVLKKKISVLLKEIKQE